MEAEACVSTFCLLHKLSRSPPVISRSLIVADCSLMPATGNPYIIQTIFILVPPAFFAASIYMVLGNIIVTVDGESYSLIKKRWLTKTFVTGDVLSFLVQAGGMQSLSVCPQKWV